MYIKRNVRINNLETIELSMKGQETCAKGIVKINGIEMRKGIMNIQLNLKASEEPEVFIDYHPNLITKEVGESLGIEKLPSYQKGN